MRPYTVAASGLEQLDASRLSVIQSQALGYDGVADTLPDGITYCNAVGVHEESTAELAVAAVHEALPLRQCTARLSPRRPSAACVLAGMRRRGAPCLGPDDGESVEAYAAHAAAYRTAVGGDPAAVVEALTSRIAALAADERFEDAAAQRVLVRGRREVGQRRGIGHGSTVTTY